MITEKTDNQRAESGATKQLLRTSSSQALSLSMSLSGKIFAGQQTPISPAPRQHQQTNMLENDSCKQGEPPDLRKFN